MTPSQILLEGVELMLFGIGSVFVFLILLIGCIRAMSYVIGRLDKSAAHPTVSARVAVAEAGPDADIVAAIQAAIHQHRARRG